ncbi:tumor necrosis factor receptor superfamily member 11A-like isoform X2 [Dreissena polymorpha]|uniref:tumor necrosis factor receptor superfamily member 11A-like isoform X2 n=1 Tax=Dreissena polymorpha TaxID=45954 RepID=UPI002263D202|nr:tumor necrosis factor receptor superfamily member 11A-like isoform X2 [Dreissena polymorpha]XP_052245506.1 tumor necrosis factor receptor superfamily member 11A-like isoform X2 [Dreissena polymorpha]
MQLKIVMMKGSKYIRVALVLGLVGLVGTIMDDTYHTTSSGHTCKKCEPGTYWVADCTSNMQQDQCLPCPSGTYQPNFNIAHSCAPCKTMCPGNNHQEARMVIQAECTLKSDLKCICSDGYWMEQGPNPVCRTVSACPLGTGVVKLADQYNNTTCERCRPGTTYSNISSKTETCQNCSVCGPDQEVNQACNIQNDTICVSKDVSKDEQHGFPIEAIVGLVVVAVVIAIAALVTIVFLYFKRRKDGKSTTLKDLCVRGNECINEESSSQGTDVETPLNPQLPGLLKDDSLSRIAGQIGINWMSTGLSLGLTNATLDQIKMDYHWSIQEAIRRMLMRWRDDHLDKNPHPSFEEMKRCLVQALKVHEGTLAYQLEQIDIKDTYQ